MKTPKLLPESMQNLTEFSKWFVVTAVRVWICGGLYGGIVLLIQIYLATYSIDLTGYLMYLAVPLTAGAVGYFCKAAFENREKIKNSRFEQQNEPYLKGYAEFMEKEDEEAEGQSNELHV
ncbi:hypothetical protein SDC9_127922 [bioreactor metagenome]|uniref:Uncharacterized protein n=1 Tax=bioreactor metagenome TaxID=1076179 RepID=A0A645CVD9_9ZZZZ|nr:hypothetical protein [Oscillospiraceae bacterium]